MATKQISGGVRDGEYVEIEGQSDDITELAQSQEDELRSVLSELGSDPNQQNVYIKVLKFEKDEPDPWECFRSNVAEIEKVVDRIRDDYGSGIYRVHVIKNKRLYKIINLKVLAPKPQQYPGAVNSQSSDLSSVLRTLAENQQRQFEQMKELFLQRTGTVATPTNPVEMMTAMMGAMIQMKEFISPPQQNGSFDNFLTLLTVAQEFNSNKGESNFVDVIRDAMKNLGPVLGTALEQQQQKVLNQQTQNPRPVNDQPQSEADNVDLQKKMQQQAIIAYVNRLVQKAEKGSDPGLQAENVVDDIPEEVVKQYLLGANTIDMLAQVNPKVRDYQHWFNLLQGNLIEMAIERGWIDNPPPPEEKPPSA